jgi:hypothetical protein
MLFGYPIEATTENWLHECLEKILHSIHGNLASGNILKDLSEVLSEPYRSRLNRRLKISDKPNSSRLSLGDKLNSYQSALKNLTSSEQKQILQAFNDQNDIALLLSGHCTCQAITDLPESIRKPIKSLFEAAFDLLTDLEIRDRHYQKIYDACAYHLCPFCGCEYFDAPGAPREALDHYLLKNNYPFAAANLRNLVPMGSKCNSSHKGTQDILKRDGKPRKAFDPYNHEIVTISLDNSQPFAGTIGKTGEQLPKWKIDFSRDCEEVTTWDEVFHIRERYARDVLDEGFNSYLREFGNYCRSWKFVPSSTEELIDAITRYISFQESNGFKDKAFLKASVFRMLRVHCQKGNERLSRLMMDVATSVSA